MIKIKNNSKGDIIVMDGATLLSKSDAIKVIKAMLDKEDTKEGRDLLGDCLIRIGRGRYYEGEILYDFL